MNKKILYLIPIIILILLFIVIFNKKEDTGKFYLDDKYYNNGEFIGTKKVNNGSYLLNMYGDMCIFSTPCEDIFKVVMEKYKIDVLSISYDDFKSTKYAKDVLYAPSFLIIKNGKLIAYLDSESDSDLEIYQDSDKFEEWLSKYIYLEK